MEEDRRVHSPSPSLSRGLALLSRTCRSREEDGKGRGEASDGAGLAVDSGPSLWEVGDPVLEITLGCAGQGRSPLKVFKPGCGVLTPTTTRTWMMMRLLEGRAGP